MTPHTITHYEVWYRPLSRFPGNTRAEFEKLHTQFATKDEARVALYEERELSRRRMETNWNVRGYEYQLREIITVVRIETDFP